VTTRAAILKRAFAAISIADYVFDLTPDEQAYAFGELDAMMAQWEGAGIDLDYVPGGASASGSTDIATPSYADDAIALNLALRLAPSFGKITTALQFRAAQALQLVRAKTLTLPRLKRPASSIHGGGERWLR
jgi:hypothetical protein